MTQSFEVVVRPKIVLCVPQVTDGRLLLVRQYRAGQSDNTLEFPAGRVEPNESPEEAIRRELLEEAGFVAEEINSIGALWTAPHFADEVGTVFVASGEVRRLPNPTPKEDFLEPELVSVEDLYLMIADGRLTDAKTIAALIMALISLGKVAT